MSTAEPHFVLQRRRSTVVNLATECQPDVIELTPLDAPGTRVVVRLPGFAQNALRQLGSGQVPALVWTWQDR